MTHVQVKAGLNSVLLPRTREIEQEVSTMQQEATIVTNKSKEEQAEVEEELARMAKLVFTFQVCKHSLSNASTNLILTLFHTGCIDLEEPW